MSPPTTLLDTSVFVDHAENPKTCCLAKHIFEHIQVSGDEIGGGIERLMTYGGKGGSSGPRFARFNDLGLPCGLLYLSPNRPSHSAMFSRDKEAGLIENTIFDELFSKVQHIRSKRVTQKNRST